MNTRFWLAAPLALIPSLLLAVACASDTDSPSNGSALNTASVDQAVVTPFKGCRGTGTSVCAELVDPSYFVAHGSCTAVYGCMHSYYDCWSDCPAPTPTEIPNVHLKASGSVTAGADLIITDQWDITKANVSIIEPNRPLVDYQTGASLYVAPGYTPSFSCYTEDPHSKVTGAVIKWTDGTTMAATCSSDTACYANNIPLKGGFTVVCKYAAR